MFLFTTDKKQHSAMNHVSWQRTIINGFDVKKKLFMGGGEPVNINLPTLILQNQK